MNKRSTIGMVTKENLLLLFQTLSLDSDAQILKAINIAQLAHKGQLRENGLPYLNEHIFPMTLNIVNRYSQNNNVKTLLLASLLHDTIEDTNLPGNLIRDNFGDEVLKIVLTVTKTPYENDDNHTDQEKSDLNLQYLQRVMKGSNEAIIIKLEDRLQNLQSTSRETALRRVGKYIRYTMETDKQFFPLIEVLNNGVDYKSLMNIEINRLKGILDI